MGILVRVGAATANETFETICARRFALSCVPSTTCDRAPSGTIEEFGALVKFATLQPKIERQLARPGAQEHRPSLALRKDLGGMYAPDSHFCLCHRCCLERRRAGASN